MAKTTGATSGVAATGSTGRNARQAAQDAAITTPTAANVPVWARPDAKFSDDDDSIDARMNRLHKSREATR